LLLGLLRFLVLGFGLQAERTENEDQPPVKRRLLSAVVKVRVFLILLGFGHLTVKKSEEGIQQFFVL